MTATEPPTDRPLRVFLIGLMGAGKSTVGHGLAARTGWRYVDNDELIEAATGRDAPSIVAEEGAGALHAAELAAFDHGAALPPPVVVGVAGYVVMDPVARTRMAEAGTTVWLRARAETLHRRVGLGAGRRPAATSLDWVRQVIADRSATFLEAADIVVDVDDLGPDEVVAAVLARLRPD